MAKFVVVDGSVYINHLELIGGMVDAILDETWDNKSIVVDEEESAMVDAYQKMLRKIGMTSLEDEFRKQYVVRRFWNRVNGV